MHTVTRRVRILRIPQEDVAVGIDLSAYGLPDGTVILDNQKNLHTLSTDYLVYHESFPVVPVRNTVAPWPVPQELRSSFGTTTSEPLPVKPAGKTRRGSITGGSPTRQRSKRS